MSDQKTTFNSAAVGPDDYYRESRTQLFAQRRNLGNQDPDDPLHTAQARIDAVNHRALVLNRV
ncbi:MAG: hypothetical protein JNN09_03690 [Alphaproteobacteria bacterium]|nr:hypothetical protein [Alphaproteobacteria bacterium]